MGRKIKFGEPMKMISIRVPVSLIPKIKDVIKALKDEHKSKINAQIDN
jgi:hypothetical protein